MGIIEHHVSHHLTAHILILWLERSDSSRSAVVPLWRCHSVTTLGCDDDSIWLDMTRCDLCDFLRALAPSWHNLAYRRRIGYRLVRLVRLIRLLFHVVSSLINHLVCRCLLSIAVFEAAFSMAGRLSLSFGIVRSWDLTPQELHRLAGKSYEHDWTCMNYEQPGTSRFLTLV